MPKMSDTMTEGRCIQVATIKIGDNVKSGDLVADIETDKATMEFESYQEGVCCYTRASKEGRSVTGDGILAILGKAGEDYKRCSMPSQKKVTLLLLKKRIAVTPQDKKEESAEKENTCAGTVTLPCSKTPAPSVAASDSRLKASPLAKKLAGEKGIDLGKILGSANTAVIVKRDIDWFLKKVISLSAGTEGLLLERKAMMRLRYRQMRKTIAAVLVKANFQHRIFTSPWKLTWMQPLPHVIVSMQCSTRRSPSMTSLSKPPLLRCATIPK
jgi:pyruvate dehydrogenase E2 component (dihydrolipoamide acetyltransferase)